jgi:hypothetical protein
MVGDNPSDLMMPLVLSIVMYDVKNLLSEFCVGSEMHLRSIVSPADALEAKTVDKIENIIALRFFALSMRILISHAGLLMANVN